jgi:hypothetical protein
MGGEAGTGGESGEEHPMAITPVTRMMVASTKPLADILTVHPLF